MRVGVDRAGLALPARLPQCTLEAGLAAIEALESIHVQLIGMTNDAYSAIKW